MLRENATAVAFIPIMIQELVFDSIFFRLAKREDLENFTKLTSISTLRQTKKSLRQNSNS